MHVWTPFFLIFVGLIMHLCTRKDEIGNEFGLKLRLVVVSFMQLFQGFQ